jgi:predicted DCC family thiol-disulfide oxidoreductase YuxK
MTDVPNTGELQTQPAAEPMTAAPSTWRRRFALLIIAGAVLWALFAFGIMPRMIANAYDGGGLEVLRKQMAHRDAHPVEHYIGKWTKLAGLLLAAWLGGGALLLGTTSARFARFIGTATPGTLGAIRVLTCTLLAYMIIDAGVAHIPNLPDTQRVPMGVMDYFYRVRGFEAVVRDHTAIEAFRWCVFGLMAMCAIGYKTRLIMPFAAVLYLALVGIPRSYFWFNHSGLVPWYVLCVLCFTRCADGWSLDRMLRIWRNQPVVPADEKRPHYAWARYACWMVICLPYVAAGMSKLRNGTLLWWEGLNMQAILYSEALRPSYNDVTFILSLTWLPTWFFGVMGLMTVISEIGMGLILVWRYARYFFPLFCLGMHLGISLFMYIDFWDLFWLQLVFYDWRAIRLWFADKFLKARARVELLYDGLCPLCTKSAVIVRHLDLFRRVDLIDFRKLDVAEFNRAHGTALTAEQMQRQMHVVRGNHVAGGYEAWRALAARLPLLWPIWPLLALPGITHAGRRIYAYVARNRFALHCTDTCAANPVAGQSALSLAWRQRTLAGPLAVSGIALLLLGCWVNRVEFYPLTAMQMFSTYDTTGTVIHYRVYMTDEAGNTRIAYLEHMGVGNTRYRPTLKNAFVDPPGREKCHELLAKCADYWNRRVPPEQRVAKFEVHMLVWDFINDRYNEHYGEVTETFTYEVPPMSELEQTQFVQG